MAGLGSAGAFAAVAGWDAARSGGGHCCLGAGPAGPGFTDREAAPLGPIVGPAATPGAMAGAVDGPQFGYESWRH